MPATPCPSCGKPSYAKVMCRDCRRSRPRSPKGYWSRRAPCTVCGELAWKSPTGADPTHKKCAPRHRGAAAGCGTPCEVCGSPTNPLQKRRFCSRVCAGKADSARRLALRGEGATTHARRVDREVAAVGLRPSERKRLRQKWKQQKRTCAYCSALATTIDHVIPLVRGGTNYEGNLVPCCLSCNSRKQDRLAIEFRLGLRASQTYTPFRERPKAERTVKVKAQKPAKPTSPCLICRQPCVRQTCSKPCAVEWNTRQIREAYRARVGLPPTWDVPSKPRVPRHAA